MAAIGVAAGASLQRRSPGQTTGLVRGRLGRNS